MERSSTGPDPRAGVDLSCLRRGALAASVLHDVPMEPRPEGVAVGRDWHDRESWVPVSWRELAEATAGADPEGTSGRLRLRDWLRARPRLAGLADDDRRLVPLALPLGHAVHPGAGWAWEQLPGGVLELGPALRVLDGDDELVIPVSASVARAAGVDRQPWWAQVRGHLEAMGALAVARLVRDDAAVLAPVGGCDVLTLLASGTLRRHLAGSDGTGMRAVAVPMRRRGWFDLARIDPPFVLAAAHATSVEERGVDRPLLVTEHEVATARRVVDVAALARRALAEPAADDRDRRNILYR
ncbi:MAG TPA: hypothetical protein VFL94_10380 [Actinomycetales bacterium]|nr:hypothetical protein [Actinomycetales bacterium]